MAASISKKNAKELNSGFSAYPIKFNHDSEAGHVMYFKEHATREPCELESSNRTVFIINIPPYTTKKCLERLFSGYGKTESVIVQQAPGPSPLLPSEDDSQYFPTRERIKGFHVAYITYEDADSIQRLKKKKAKDQKILSTPKAQIPTGLAKWCNEYRNQRPQIDLLQKDIDEFMQAYDKEKKTKERKRKAEEEPDDEGWITVSKKGSKPGIARTEKNQTRTLAAEMKKRKRKELANFYTFQMRETKREHIAELRKKFEEDKQKISEMKAARKFKPY